MTLSIRSMATALICALLAVLAFTEPAFAAQAVQHNAPAVHSLLSHPLFWVSIATLGTVGANTSTIDGLLKRNYESFIAEQVNNKNPFKDVFRTETVPYGGSETTYTAHVSRNVSPMFVGEDGAMADAGAQGHVQIRVNQKKLMGRVRLTPEAMYDTSKGEYAWKQARKDEFDGLIKDLARREEYALTLDGRGVLAIVNGAATSATQTVDAPGGIAGADFGNRFIMRGQYVGYINPATGALRTDISKVISVSSDGTQFTANASFTSVDNDYVVQAANSSVTDVLDTSYEQAFWGIMALVDDGTYRTNYFGADRDLYDAFKSYVKASTGALSLDVMQQAADIVDQKLNGKTNLLCMHHAIRRVYIAILQADRRYHGTSLMKPDGGTAAFQQGDLTMGEVPIKAIRDLPFSVVLGLDTANSEAVKYESEPGKWVDEDGRILVRVGSGSSARDAFEAWYRIRRQYHMRYPAVNWRLDGITGQTIVVVRPAGD